MLKAIAPLQVGKISADGTPEANTEAYSIEKMYGCIFVLLR
jgi:hypothetical protein